jgi:fructose-1,6-bisphosphatase/inositol monophosphatase family enzyme
MIAGSGYHFFKLNRLRTVRFTMTDVPHYIQRHDKHELLVAYSAAIEGGNIIRDKWVNQPHTFAEKDGHYDLVSEVDAESDSLIQSIIREQYPNDRIISEELNPDTDDVKLGGRVWICDPLDGTACFLFKTDPLAPSVMIALMVDGIPEVAVVYQPIANICTYSVRGKGTFVDDLRVSITSGSSEGLTQAWVDLNQYGDAHFESAWFSRIDKFVRSEAGARLVSRSPPHSAIALRLLQRESLRGLEACLHDHNPKKPKQLPWDIIPIQLIIEEAGGMYVDCVKGLGARLDPFNLEGPILIGSKSTVKYILDNA